MSNERNIKTVFPREAAVLALETLLAPKSKGDRITSSEVLAATGMRIETLRGRIKTWAKRKNLTVLSVPNDGYRILTDVEHVDYARSKAGTAARAEGEALRSLVITDQSKLDEAQSRRHEFMLKRTAARAATAKHDQAETKAEFKLTERVPLRALTGGK